MFARTVTGDIPIDALGVCQCHEHIFIERGRSAEISPALVMEDERKSVSELNAYARAGGRSLVDAQPVFAGRMAEELAEASEKSGILTIASTGFHKTVFYPEDSPIFTMDEQTLADLFAEEIMSGMLASQKRGYGKTAIRAGIIKTAADADGIRASKTARKLFEAAAQAAKATGAAVLTHIEKGADAFEVIGFFTDRGVEADRLILCHLDRARYDFSVHAECLSSGVFLEYDTILRYKYHDDRAETDLIAEMLKRGHGRNLLLGLDTTNERMRAYSGGGIGLFSLLCDFVPYLERSGIPERDIRGMLIENPKRALFIREDHIEKRR